MTRLLFETDTMLCSNVRPRRRDNTIYEASSLTHSSKWTHGSCPTLFLFKLTAGAIYRAEREPKALLSSLAEIISLADSEKEALSFLPHTAYKDAIEKRRLVGMFSISDGETKLVGYVLFSGVYPNDEDTTDRCEQ